LPALKAVKGALQAPFENVLPSVAPTTTPKVAVLIISPKEIKRAANVSSGLTKKQGYINGSYLTALASLHPFT